MIWLAIIFCRKLFKNGTLILNQMMICKYLSPSVTSIPSFSPSFPFFPLFISLLSSIFFLALINPFPILLLLLLLFPMIDLFLFFLIYLLLLLVVLLVVVFLFSFNFLFISSSIFALLFLNLRWPVLYVVSTIFYLSLPWFTYLLSNQGAFSIRY